MEKSVELIELENKRDVMVDDLKEVLREIELLVGYDHNTKTSVLLNYINRTMEDFCLD